jgi:serine/threonine-protein kinase HipA
MEIAFRGRIAKTLFLSYHKHFCGVLGKSDAHGKNMSFFLTRQGLKVAPAYGQLCVKPYAELEQNFAMAIGDQFNADEVRAFDWADFAMQCGIGLLLLGKELKRIAAAIAKALPETMQDPVFNAEERVFLAAISDLVIERVRRLQKMAPQAPKMRGMFEEFARPRSDGSVEEV